MISRQTLQRFGEIAVGHPGERGCRHCWLSADLPEDSPTNENDHCGDDEHADARQYDGQRAGCVKSCDERGVIGLGCGLSQIADLKQIVADFSPGRCFFANQKC